MGFPNNGGVHFIRYPCPHIRSEGLPLLSQDHWHTLRNRYRLSIRPGCLIDPTTSESKVAELEKRKPRAYQEPRLRTWRLSE